VSLAGGENVSNGVVTGLDGDHVWVEVATGSGCGSCESQGSCGSGILGVSARPRRYRLPNDIGARAGDVVSISMPGGGVLRAALLSYLLPLALGLAGAAAGMWLGGGDGHALLGLGAGLGVGLLILRRAARRGEPGLRISLQSQVIRLQPRYSKES
jgi:sigma-E factor negative regulatory protein RseC